MVFAPLYLAVLALASASVVSDAQPQDDQVFTSYVPVATTTIHVGAPSSTTSAPAPTATIPADWLRYGVEVAAIQWANYRQVGLSHQDAVKLVRDGLNLYTQQPDISNLINNAYGFYLENADGLKNKTIALPSDFSLKAVRAFHEANEKLLASPGFTDLNAYLNTNLNKFDVGAGISDLQKLVEINPVFAHKALAKAHTKINSSPENAQAFEELFSMVTSFAKKYNVQGDVVQSGINNMLNAILM